MFDVHIQSSTHTVNQQEQRQQTNISEDVIQLVIIRKQSLSGPLWWRNGLFNIHSITQVMMVQLFCLSLIHMAGLFSTSPGCSSIQKKSFLPHICSEREKWLCVGLKSWDHSSSTSNLQGWNASSSSMCHPEVAEAAPAHTFHYVSLTSLNSPSGCM